MLSQERAWERKEAHKDKHQGKDGLVDVHGAS